MIRKTSDGDERWLDLDGFAEVDVSRPKRRCTQSSLHCLLRPQTESSCEAAEPGPQTVRILFDRPQRIDNVLLEFQEFQLARTQEFLLRWSSNAGNPIVKLSASNTISVHPLRLSNASTIP